MSWNICKIVYNFLKNEKGNSPWFDVFPEICMVSYSNRSKSIRLNLLLISYKYFFVASYFDINQLSTSYNHFHWIFVAFLVCSILYLLIWKDWNINDALPLMEPLELFCPAGDWTLLWPRLFACASSFEVTLLHMSNIRCVYIIISGKCEALVTFQTFAGAVADVVAAAVDWWNSCNCSCSYVHLVSVDATADEHGHSHRRPYAAYAQFGCSLQLNEFGFRLDLSFLSCL